MPTSIGSGSWQRCWRGIEGAGSGWKARPLTAHGLVECERHDLVDWFFGLALLWPMRSPGRMRAMKSDASVFRMRAESFLIAMRDLRELGPSSDSALADPDYRSAIALLAVHSAISFSDAILVLALGSPSTGDHKAAPKKLRAAVAARNIPGKEVAIFSRLIGSKHELAYGRRNIRPTDVASAVVDAERFAAWSYEAMQGLEGRYS